MWRISYIWIELCFVLPIVWSSRRNVVIGQAIGVLNIESYIHSQLSPAHRYVWQHCFQLLYILALVYKIIPFISSLQTMTFTLISKLVATFYILCYFQDKIFYGFLNAEINKIRWSPNPRGSCVELSTMSILLIYSAEHA